MTTSENRTPGQPNGLYAAEVIDGTRDAYKAGQVSRNDAIFKIRAVANVTEIGAADLLDHELSATARYAPTTYAQPPQPAPKKKHTARNVLLAALGAIVAICGIAGVGGLMLGGDTKTTGVITSDTSRDPTPELTTEPAATTPEPAAPTTKPKPTAPAVKPLSIEQQNAIQAAKDYLEYMPFSRKGLIQQLHSDAGDGYPLKVATYAVDSLHIDFNEQAALSAKTYLEYSSFSRKGLIEQLSSDAGEGFTHAQAVYGVTKAGL